MEIDAIRHHNLGKLLDRYNTDREFAEAAGLSPGHVSQMKNGTRAMGKTVARQIEEQLNLGRGWMDTVHPEDRDQPHDPTAAPQPSFDGAKFPPVVGTAQLGSDGYWMELEYPTGHGEGFVTYPSRDRNAYALRCKGDSMRPRIKPGEFVVVEPNHAYVPGDEVVIKDKKGRVMVKVFAYQRNGSIEVNSVNEDHKPMTIELEDVVSIHYVAAICKPALYYRDIA